MKVVILPNISEHLLVEWNDYAQRCGVSLEQLITLLTTLSVRSDRLQVGISPLPAISSNVLYNSSDATLKNLSNLQKNQDNIAEESKAKRRKSNSYSESKRENSGTDAGQSQAVTGDAVTIPEDWVDGPTAAELEDSVPSNV